VLLVQKKVVKVLMILIIITRMVKLPRLGQIRGRVAGAATWVARTGGPYSLVPFAHGLQALAYRPCSKLPVALQSGRIWGDREKEGCRRIQALFSQALKALKALKGTV
jgi:hypothetical protein